MTPLTILSSPANFQSTRVLRRSISEIFGTVVFKTEQNLPSIITQLCIVKESLSNYQLFHIDSTPMGFRQTFYFVVSLTT